MPKTTVLLRMSDVRPFFRWQIARSTISFHFSTRAGGDGSGSSDQADGMKKSTVLRT